MECWVFSSISLSDPQNQKGILSHCPEGPGWRHLPGRATVGHPQLPRPRFGVMHPTTMRTAVRAPKLRGPSTEWAPGHGDFYRYGYCPITCSVLGSRTSFLVRCSVWLDELESVPGGKGTMNAGPPRTPAGRGAQSLFPWRSSCGGGCDVIDGSQRGARTRQQRRSQEPGGPSPFLVAGSLLVPRVPAPECCEPVPCAQKETMSWSSLDAGQRPDLGLCIQGRAQPASRVCPSGEDRDPQGLCEALQTPVMQVWGDNAFHLLCLKCSGHVAEGPGIACGSCPGRSVSG